MLTITDCGCYREIQDEESIRQAIEEVYELVASLRFLDRHLPPGEGHFKGFRGEEDPLFDAYRSLAKIKRDLEEMLGGNMTDFIKSYTPEGARVTEYRPRSVFITDVCALNPHCPDEIQLGFRQQEPQWGGLEGRRLDPPDPRLSYGTEVQHRQDEVSYAAP